VQQWCSEHPWEIRAEDKAGQCVDQESKTYYLL